MGRIGDRGPRMIEIPEAYAAGALAASMAGFRIYMGVCYLGMLAYVLARGWRAASPLASDQNSSAVE